MTLVPVMLVWLVLILALGLELLLATVPDLRGALPLLGIASAGLVAITFMRLGSSRGLVPIFAVAGMFWLMVMLGLGSLDSFTRHDIPVGRATEQVRR